MILSIDIKLEYLIKSLENQPEGFGTIVWYFILVTQPLK